MTSISFNPVNASPPFSAQFILDGKSYLAVGSWNLFAQRWMLSLTSESGDLAWAGPIIGSPPDYDIELAPGVFTSKIIFRSEVFEIS